MASGHRNNCAWRWRRNVHLPDPSLSRIVADMSAIEDRLLALGHQLPAAPAPGGMYVPAVRTGNLVFLSGTICIRDGQMTHQGKLGDAHDVSAGQEGARVCTLNLLSALKAEIGDLDRVRRVVMLHGYVNAVAGFDQSPQVINGASELLNQIFGDKGSHARAAVAVAGLPRDSAVEVEAIVEVEG